MQIFYTDISKIFECDITLTGATIVEAQARLIFNVSNKEFLFNGTIDGLGHCVFNIPALNVYNLVGSGNMYLEVVIENVIFKPFTDTIKIIQSDGSDFDTFVSTTNYDSVNYIDTNYTYLNKKVYNEAPYLVIPGNKFNIKLGDTQPDLKFFVFKLGEQFGDPIPLPNISSYTSITLKVYNYNYSLICYGLINNYDQISGQFTYKFNSLDFSVSGIYYFEVEFIGTNISFTLPTTNTKYEIIVRE